MNRRDVLMGTAASAIALTAPRMSAEALPEVRTGSWENVRFTTAPNPSPVLIRILDSINRIEFDDLVGTLSIRPIPPDQFYKLSPEYDLNSSRENCKGPFWANYRKDRQPTGRTADFPVVAILKGT